MIKFDKFEDDCKSMDDETRADWKIHRIMQLLSEKKMEDEIYTGLIEMMHRSLLWHK